MQYYIAVDRDKSEIVAYADCKSWFTHGDPGDNNAHFDPADERTATVAAYGIPIEDFASGKAFIGCKLKADLPREIVGFLKWKEDA